MGELFRRFWLPVLMPSELPTPDCPPVRVRILGEDLVAFRDSSGRVGLLEERCAHRGASLFFGRNEECGLRCVYHGWKYDVEGTCLEMPNEPAESSYRQKVKQNAYPTREYGGLIWAYLGPSELAPELPALEWALACPDQRALFKWEYNAGYLQGMEGEVDTAHLTFLHRYFDRSFAPGNLNTLVDGAPQLAVQDTDYGLMYGGRRRTADGQGYNWRVSHWLLPTYSLLPGDFPRGGRCYVPIDDEHTWVFAYYYHPHRPLAEPELARLHSGLSSWPALIPGTFRPAVNAENDYGLDREMQRTVNFTGIAGVSDQDRAIVESMGPLYDRSKEHLGTSDVAVIAVRRILMKLARDLQKGIEPFAPSHGDAYRVRALEAVAQQEDFGSFAEAHMERLRPGDLVMAP
jgi:phenylpropionate dioxygenase-like ring-hydroxylating dioxygenase large terminal subunit